MDECKPLERGVSTTSVMRDDVTPAHVAAADLVIALVGRCRLPLSNPL